MRRGTLVPFVVAAVLGAAWLNQGAPRAPGAVGFDAARTSPVAIARYVVGELYERSGDEAIDFAVARATRGLPYDQERLLSRGHDTPASFGRAPPADGRWHRPYVEVPFEYPAALLPFVVVPSFLAGTFEGYTRVCGVLMTLLLLAATAFAVRSSPERQARACGWGLVALLLAQGSLIVERLDAVPTLLLAGALWAAVRRRPATTGVALGLATASKLFPIFLVPLLVAADREAWRTPSARTRGLVGFASALGAGLLPMLFPVTALVDVVRYHCARGLQVESTGGVLLALAHLLAGEPAPATLSFGSYNLDGPVASSIATLCTPIMLVGFAAAVGRFAAAPPPASDTDRADQLASSLLSGLAILWLSAKAFSPQYLTWAIPFVLAVSGKRGRVLRLLLFAIMALTQVYARAFYGQIIAGTAVGVGFLAVRLPLLVTFAVVALRGARTTSLAPAALPAPARREPSFEA